MKKVIAVLASLAVIFSFTGAAAPMTKGDYSLNISKDNISYNLSDKLYGVFLEDAGFAGDGGLCGELVNNNSFEYDSDSFMAWSINAAEYSAETETPLNENNPHYLKLTVDKAASAVNRGYPEIYDYKSYSLNKKKAEAPDMGFKADEEYLFSAYFKNIDYEGTVTASLLTGSEEKKVQFDIDNCQDWKKVSLTLMSSTDADGALSISFEGTGSLLMDFVSLVPKSSHGFESKNWKYTALRTDLYDAVAGLSPKFIRFPGGCTAEGSSLEELYNWKDTIGPLEERRQTYNICRDDANGRQYNNTSSLGYHEYFTLCEELGAEPVPVLNAGICCQARAGYADAAEKYENGALSEIKWQEYLDTIAYRPGTPEWDAYIQDVLDFIEYANGDASTEWGAKRAENGHPEPFGMKYIAVGTENWGEVYWRNFAAVCEAVKPKYPNLKIIASSGMYYDGKDFDEAWKTVKEKYSDMLVCESCYTDDGYNFEHTDRYDSYERSGASVIVGGYSAQSRGLGAVQTKNNIWAALQNAAFLTGAERNGDIVEMASYAPTLSKINAQCGDVSLIWFDSQNTVLTPDYYLQMLFANNRGTKYISTDFNKEDEGIYQTVSVDEENEVIYIKLVNSSRTNRKIDINLKGFENVGSPTVQLMDETFKSACNEIGEPLRVAPVQRDLKLDGDKLVYEAGSLSVGVIRIPYGKNDGSKLYELPQTGIITPYMHPAISVAIPIIMLVFLAVTGGVVLGVRIKRHKELRKKEEEAEE